MISSIPSSLAVAWLGLLVVVALCPTATNAFLVPSSIIYTLKHTEWNFLRMECAVGIFTEPDTAITMTMTDGFSKYIGVTFPPDRILKIEGRLPYALYSIFTIYMDNGLENFSGVLLDSDIQLDNDKPNPYVIGNPIQTDMADRSYTVYASRERPEFATNNNWMSTDSGKREKISVFILRVVGEYGDEQGLSNYEWFPTVTLLDQDGNQERCNFFLDQGRLPTIGIETTYATPIVAPKECRVYDADVFPEFHFYPMAVQSKGFANTAHGGYLMADVNHEADNLDTRAFVVEIKAPPRVFDPQGQMAANNSAVYYGDEDVRYTSLCLYANLMTNMFRDNNCISGIDIYNHYMKHGTAYIVGGDPSLREHFESKGVLFMELVASDAGAEMHRWPKLIYRVQLFKNPEYIVDDHVPRWDEQCDEKHSNGYYMADNQENWGDYAPIGRQCSSEDVVSNACGFEQLEMILHS